MKTTALLFAAFIFVFAMSLSAQVVVTELQGERPIDRLPAFPPGDKELAETRCGDHFLYFANPEGYTPPGPRIGYILQSRKDDPAVKGQKVRMTMIFLKMKFRVLIDNAKKNPTSEFILSRAIAGEVHAEGENTFHVVLNPNDIDEILIRISAADFQKSTCLPQPSRFR